MIPIKRTQNGKPYQIILSKNQREAIVMQDYHKSGWIVLKNGWPDLLCYNPTTKQVELVEVKARSQFQVRKKNGKAKRKLGLSQCQLRMHQYLKKLGFTVKIIHVE